MKRYFGKRGGFVWVTFRRFVLVAGFGNYGDFRKATDFTPERGAVVDP